MPFFKKTFDASEEKFNNSFLNTTDILSKIGLIIYTIGWVGILLGFFTMKEIYYIEIIE